MTHTDSATDQDKTSPNNTAITQPNFQLLSEATFKTIQNLLSMLLGFATILTASGFIIVNIHLSRFTTMLGYSVSPTQYITAGLGFWLVGLFCGFIVWRLTSNTKPLNKNEKWGSYSKEQVVEILKHSRSVLSGFLRERRFSELFTAIRYLFLIRSVLATEQIAVTLSSRRGRLSFIVFYFILGGIAWGLLYMNVPRYLGGGYPAYISIVLKQGVDAKSIGLTLETTNSNRTFPVILLANLNDGILIVDSVSGRVVELHNDTILALVDSKPFQPIADLNIAATLTAIPTSTLPASGSPAGTSSLSTPTLSAPSTIEPNPTP